MTLSNQYPRLHWEPQPEATSLPSFVARPHADGWARVYLHRIDTDGRWWSWTAHWPGRFSEGGMVLDKQEAADKATIAYWDAMAAMENWVPPPPPPKAPVPDLVALLFFGRLERWLLQVASRTEVIEHIHRYRRTVLRGSKIIDAAIDQRVWQTLSERLPRATP